MRALKSGIQRRRLPADELGSIASLATMLAAVGRALAGRDAGGNSSWVSTRFSCVKAGTSWWRWLRSDRPWT